MKYPKTLEELEDAWLSEMDEKDKSLHEASMRIYRAEFNGDFYVRPSGCREGYKDD